MLRIGVLLLMLCTTTLRAEITITQPALYENEGRIWVNAEFRYRLEAGVIDAMKNGIPLVFRAEYLIEEVRPPWESNPVVHQIEHRFVLSYREFTNRYYLISLQNKSHGTYDTLADAVARMEKRHTAIHISREQLAKNRNYQARLRASIDEQTLPGLMRPYLYTPWLWPEWKLDSGWHTLPIEHHPSSS